MDPIMLVVVPGFLGGLIIAMVIIRRQRTPGDHAAPAVFHEERLSTDVINMAHIKVAGVGGLGLVAVSVVVALFLPSIRQPVAVGLVLGALLGAVLILRRRQAGPMPSSGRRPGANTTLSIDVAEPSPDERPHGSSGVRMVPVS
jgi:hypothetical protein